jgi:2'-5' RNA ligase superfamily protein
MHGIVSLLDNDYNRLVEELWAELEREFSVHGVYVTPYPHFSYHVAKDYDVDKIEPVLQRITSDITTFKVRTSGLGVFTGNSPVLYIPVARSLELTQLHEELWQEVATASSGVQQYYHPGQWMPHITIGFGDISKDNLSQIIPFLAERNFSWEITVDNIALIYDTGIKQELKSRFDITGELRPGESGMKGLHWHPKTSEVLEQLDRVRERIVQESNGFIFEDSSESIRQQREERTRQLLGEDED